MKEKFVKNGEVEVQYLAVNYSPAETPLIIIPGAIVGADDFYNDIKEYADFYYIIISLRGRGKSSSPISGYTKDDHISDIDAVIKTEFLDNFYILGHSFGVSVASYYSIKNSEKISGLIIADFPPVYPAYSEDWAGYIRNNCSGINDNFLKGMVKESVYEDFMDELMKTNFKKLIIKGRGSDSLLKQETAEKISEKMPDTALKIINGCGHEMFMEKPYETLKEVKNFIS